MFRVTLTLNPLTRLTALIAFVLTAYVALHSPYIEAKVRPSDIIHPTDDIGLGRGYAPPGALFDIDLWGGFGGGDDPYQSRSQVGFMFTTRSPFEFGDLGVTWGMFSHSYENLIDEESGVYTTNLAVDWRWRGEDRSLHAPYFGLGIALPLRSLSGEGGLEGEAQLDANHIALASRFGGQKRWLWEPNTTSVFLESGGRATWGRFVLEGELGIAYLYRVIESVEIESANLFVQANGNLGFQGERSGLLVGGGYAISPLSLADDVDQLYTQLTYTLVQGKLEYFLSTILPIDAPTGYLGGQVGATLLVGVNGEM